MMKIKRKMMLLNLLCAVAMVAVPLTGFCADGQIKIGQTSSTTFPITINASGSYVLTSDLNVPPTSPDANAITINADNVTIDLNGHAIIGPGFGTGRGISASDTSHNFAVMNGTVRDFGDTGLYIGGNNNIVKDVRAYDNGDTGITLHGGTMTNCTADSNDGTGIDGPGSTITNCTAYYNGDGGIHAASSTVTNCTAGSNTGDPAAGYGISALYSTVTNCKADYNTGAGILSSHSTINNCAACNNNTDDSAGDGIVASDSTITNCTADSNDGDGIEGWQNNRIEGNNLRGNGAYGLNLSSDRNYAVRNSASGNTSGNFLDSGTTNYMPTTGDNANYGF